MQLPASIRTVSIRRYPADITGSVLLLVASLLVGVAIASPDPVSRAINGVSGVIWIAGAAFLIAAVRADHRFSLRLSMVAVFGMVLVLAVRPSDLLIAAVGFGVGGAAIAAVTGASGLTWAKLLAAVWLPEHLLTAVTRAVYRAVQDLPATIRSEPPPTAALVPFAMVASAWGGAWLVVRVRDQRHANYLAAARDKHSEL
jgi:uncharacterized membrane protein